MVAGDRAQLETGSLLGLRGRRWGGGGFHKQLKAGKEGVPERRVPQRGVPKPRYRLPSSPQLTPGQCMCRERCREPREEQQLKANLRMLYVGRWSLEFNSCPVRGLGKHLRLSTDTRGHSLGVRITSQD